LLSGRTTFIGFSVVAHGFMMFGIAHIEAKSSREATAIQIAPSRKPAKKPEAKVTPPPPKPAPPARERRASAAKPAEAPPPDAAPPSAAPALADVPDFGVSLSGGGVDGAGFAMPSNSRPGSRTAPSPAKSAPKRLSAVATPAVVDGCDEPAAKPKPRSVPQPGYTESARAALIEGKVRVQLTVDETGHVVSVKLLQGLGHGLDEAALAAARQVEFEPAVRCGKPISATFNISMRFSLT